MEALAGLLDGAHKSLEFFTRQLAMLRDDSESRECWICLEEDIPLEELCVLPCGHAMHLKCGGPDHAVALLANAIDACLATSGLRSHFRQLWKQTYGRSV